jgi:hypothetical protein
VALPTDRARRANTRTLSRHETPTGSRRIQLTRKHRKQPPGEAQGLPGAGCRLCLSHGSEIHVVDRNRPTVSLGRETGNDIVVDCATASRRHAHVEWRPDGFYLIDHSWNGTFVYDADGQETRVHNAERRLQDSGLLCPGCPGAHPEADALRFIEAR